MISYLLWVGMGHPLGPLVWLGAIGSPLTGLIGDRLACIGAVVV
jgi:hypothetical protein